MKDAEEIKSRNAELPKEKSSPKKRSLSEESDTIKRKLQKELEQKRKEYLLGMDYDIFIYNNIVWSQVF